jgi:hypothetical protein
MLMRSYILAAALFGLLLMSPGTSYATPPCIGSGCTLTINDGGTAGTGITAPTGANGVTGWLSGIFSQTAPLSTTPTVSSVTAVTTSTAQTVIAAGKKNFWRISNNSTSGDLSCTDDGSTPTATHWTIRIFATTMYETFRPGFVTPFAVQCIGITVTVPLVGMQI